MNKNTVNVPYKNSIDLLLFLLNQNFKYEFNYKKNHLLLYNENHEKIVQFTYPLIINLSEEVIKDKNLLNIYHNSFPDYAIMLIQTGNAALGYFNKGVLAHHKVIRKYITRKSQGKSQLKYLKTKGKSRAGSRVRLANAVQFFEEINQKMSEWIIDDETETIIYSCTPMLWGMLFNSKTKPAFDKKDLTLKKIPLNTAIPNFEVLQKMNSFSQQGYLQTFPGCPLALAANLEKLFIHRVNSTTYRFKDNFFNY